MTVSNADPPHRADHLAEQLEDVGEGKVGDVDIVRSCVQVVQKTTQRVGEVAMGQDDTLGRSLSFGDYEKRFKFQYFDADRTAASVHDDGGGRGNWCDRLKVVLHQGLLAATDHLQRIENS